MMITHEERDLIQRLFPTLSQHQREQLEALPSLYEDWNTKINVISRKDIDNVFSHHILHSLVIGRFTSFVPGTEIFDVGTGGGLPGIPLAILFPECHFTLIDSVGKKVRVAEEIGSAIGLTNVSYLHSRAEELHERCHFIVSRAALRATDLVQIGQRLINKKEQLNPLPNGIITLKGGDLSEELRPFRKIASIEEISAYLPDMEYYEEKKLIFFPA
ncbi:MAG: 16S rRNA (guanine(527)-N(7))-methyltransferase RsmG [Porphyromonas sp.]|nr:16S rRNA (guanine(527)-N(7))-methyltransferase RsmG [Porphyromonas sp.]